MKECKKEQEYHERRGEESSINGVQSTMSFELLLQTNNLSHKPRSLEATASPSCFMQVVTEEKVVSLV
jgi:hypothetical protein